MRKLAIALSAIAFALGTVTLPAVAAKKDSAYTAEKSKPKKKVMVKKAETVKMAKYTAKCKAGKKWNATATAQAGACEARAKVKTKAKSASAPAKKAAAKKVG